MLHTSFPTTSSENTLIPVTSALTALRLVQARVSQSMATGAIGGAVGSIDEGTPSSGSIERSIPLIHVHARRPSISRSQTSSTSNMSTLEEAMMQKAGI